MIRDLVALLRSIFFCAAVLGCHTAYGQILINEVDADQTAADTGEFIELYAGVPGIAALDGHVLVTFNGSSDTSYATAPFTTAISLDGYTTDESGYFVIGNAAIPGVDLVISDNTLQNGADAVAIYDADSLIALYGTAEIPAGTPVTTYGLLDALVYDTSDADDPGLLTLLNPGQPQVDENHFLLGESHSIQRCPSGSGGPLNTDTYQQLEPTPGAENTCIAATCFVDADKDGFGNDSGATVTANDGSCDTPQAESENNLDCNDGDSNTYPGAPEVFGDLKDSNCDGFDGVIGDLDVDGIPDGSDNCIEEPNPGQENFDGDSEGDACDLDDDNDGLLDTEEDRDGNGGVNGSETDPYDDDSDDDGLMDGTEDVNANGVRDSNETDPLDYDSDNDFLGDGLELGLSSPEGVNTSGSFTPDSDPASTTNPLDQDSDDDQLNDGLEDANQDGSAGAGETDPADDDTDDDGLTDGAEDSDLDGRVDVGESNPVLFDTDSDGLGDGQELGLTAPQGADTLPDVFVADSDPGTKTSALDADTDDDGLPDGIEDADADGARDANETDPLDPDTDDDGWCDHSRVDNDGNGIDPADDCESSEAENGTSPIIADTDSDTYPDPQDNCPVDYNPGQADANNDGTGNVCDPQNLCFDRDTELQGEDYPGFAYCAAANSIVAGGVDPAFVPVDGQGLGVLVRETGRVVFSAPRIELVPPFEVAAGGEFSAGPNLGPFLEQQCDLTGFSAAGQAAQRDSGSIFYYALSDVIEPYDALVIELFAPLAVGTYQLTGEDYSTCQQCVTIYTGCTASSGCERTFLASSGTLTVNSIDPFFEGSAQELELQEVTIDPDTLISTPVPGGSTHCIANWDFTAPYQP